MDPACGGPTRNAATSGGLERDERDQGPPKVSGGLFDSKPYGMLYARTQAGDHGHPRASARVGPSVDSSVKNIKKTHVNLRNAIGHR